MVNLYCLYYLEKHSKVFLDTLFELNEARANFSNDDIRDEVVTMMIGVSKYKYIYLYTWKIISH